MEKASFPQPEILMMYNMKICDFDIISAMINGGL